MIETERLTLRPWQSSDLQPFAELNACARVCELLPKPLTAAESDALAERIMAHFHEHGFGLFAVELKSSGEFIGFNGLSIPTFDAHFMPAVEIGWRLAHRHWGRGYATEAAKAALAHAFQTLRLPEIVSFTVPENTRSRRVMEKIGLHHDARDDFDHPGLPDGHRLKRHVLYRLRNPRRPSADRDS